MTQQAFRRALRNGLLMAGAVVAVTALAQDRPVTATSALVRAAPPQVLAPLEVDWQAVAAQMAAVPAPAQPYSRFKGFLAERDGVDALQVPMLLPGPGTIDMSGARISALPDSYDVIVHPSDRPGLGVIFSATRSVYGLPPGSLDKDRPQRLSLPSTAPGGRDQTITYDRSESGWTANFMRFGILYSVELTCGDIAAETQWCGDSQEIARIAGGMNEVVLGKTALAGMNAAGFKPVRPPAPPAKAGAGAVDMAAIARAKAVLAKPAAGKP